MSIVCGGGNGGDGRGEEGRVRDGLLEVPVVVVHGPQLHHALPARPQNQRHRKHLLFCAFVSRPGFLFVFVWFVVRPRELEKG